MTPGGAGYLFSASDNSPCVSAQEELSLSWRDVWVWWAYGALLIGALVFAAGSF